MNEKINTPSLLEEWAGKSEENPKAQGNPWRPNSMAFWEDAPRTKGIRHGHRRSNRLTSHTWLSWRSMIARCTNPKFPGWNRYGGRGIKVCDRWRDFRNFLQDMGERPPFKTLNRINNDGNYEPGNCNWADRYEQAANQSRKPAKPKRITTPAILRQRFITFQGETMNLYHWSRRTGIERSTIRWRLNKGLSPEQILSPVKMTMSERAIYGNSLRKRKMQSV